MKTPHALTFLWSPCERSLRKVDVIGKRSLKLLQLKGPQVGVTETLEHVLHEYTQRWQACDRRSKDIELHGLNLWHICEEASCGVQVSSANFMILESKDTFFL